MAYADQEMSGNRVIAIIVVLLLHVALFYALVTGLAVSAYEEAVKRVTTVDVIEEEEEEEPEEEEPPPPPPEEQLPPPPAVVPPIEQPLIENPVFEQTTEEITEREVVDLVPQDDGPPEPEPVVTPPCNSEGAKRKNFRRWQVRIAEAYPSRAVRRELEGNVGVSVVVGTNGRVQSCSVTGSSGESILDEAACKGMERYARYDTAVDCDRNPTTGRDSLTIVYRLN